MYRDGVVWALTASGQVEVVAEAEEGRAALAEIQAQAPDVALLDDRLPGLDGVAVVHAVVRDKLPTRVLPLSAFTDSSLVYEALQTGAAAYLPKEAKRDQIVDSVLACARGETVVPPELTAGLVSEIRMQAVDDGPMLTNREREILRLRDRRRRGGLRAVDAACAARGGPHRPPVPARASGERRPAARNPLRAGGGDRAHPAPCLVCAQRSFHLHSLCRIATTSASNASTKGEDMKLRRRVVPVGVVAVLAAVAVSATSSAATPTDSTAVKAGKIVFCSDTTYPPMESLQGGKAVGADVDIASAVAKVLGTTAEIKTTGFDVIIASLLAKKCDAIISSLTDTAERRKQVDFADYITVGMSLMVKKGNPDHITGLSSLSGKSVAVEASTTEKATLDALNKTLDKAHKAKITIKIFPSDTSAAAALITGKVSAYFADATPVFYYIKKVPGKFETAGGQIQAAPEGIATRKGDPLGAKFKTAIAKLYANGTMQKILAKWGVSQFALKK